MSANPFVADPKIQARLGALSEAHGEAIAAEIEVLSAASRRLPAGNLGRVVTAADAAALVAKYGLEGVDDLLALAVPAARKLATPPISGFFVGAAGIEAETGNIVLGGNLEFPGTHLGTTVHGEGFVFTRAFSRGTSIKTIALGEAHPCAHCRQYMSEFAATRDLTLIDMLGHRLSMSQLYPWPFDPAYLGDAGIIAGAVRYPLLELAQNDLSPAVAEKLEATGRRAHTPYSKCPAAVVLSLADGNMVAGAAIESVAFNPTMGPMQAALIDLVAHGYATSDIVSAALGTAVGAAVDFSRSTAELLAAVAPQAGLTIVGWRNT